MSFYIDGFENGVLVQKHLVDLHALVVTLTVGEVVHFDIENGAGRVPAFEAANPLNWNHTNLGESLAWDSALGTATYTANVAGEDSLAVTFEVAGRFHTGYVTVRVT